MATVTPTALILRPQPIARRVSTKVDVLTIDSLCEHFIHFKRAKVQHGELGQITFERYAETCDRIRLKFGHDTPVEEITPTDFMQYRADFPSTWGSCVIGAEVQACRSVFRYAYEAGLIDKPVRFGPGFSKPSKKLYRRERRAKGLQMFEAAEIRAMLEKARPVIRAMILLGVNCGFGNSDCGRLPFSALDLDGGWVSFHRVKTEVDRRCPLWPETIEALKVAIEMRPRPHDERDSEIVFITKYGARWADGQPSTPIGMETRRLVQRLGITRKARNFYALRRTFETIGGESLDQIAVDFIMGHSPRSNDMAAVYRQRLSDERLKAVTDHVRRWLGALPCDKPRPVPPRPKREIPKCPSQVHLPEEALTALSHFPMLRGDLLVLVLCLKELGVSQTRLAKWWGIGRPYIWKMQRGFRRIPNRTAYRLRELFGVKRQTIGGAQ